MPIDFTKVIKVDMSACGQSLAGIEDKAPTISPSNCLGPGLNSRHHGHKSTPLQWSYPASVPLLLCLQRI
ncbi:hypothetical protein E2C01_060838 [Portunus trituberculatus]|uniref:Uncharacterized protein n=1 Tax=Portunus trituberculatus TaxID=210409 RepID=A0A5B7HBN2_PORTR|nr:hypothetical protein [Portunus trituberculatus]